MGKILLTLFALLITSCSGKMSEKALVKLSSKISKANSIYVKANPGETALSHEWFAEVISQKSIPLTDKEEDYYDQSRKEMKSALKSYDLNVKKYLVEIGVPAKEDTWLTNRGEYFSSLDTLAKHKETAINVFAYKGCYDACLRKVICGNDLCTDKMKTKKENYESELAKIEDLYTVKEAVKKGAPLKRKELTVLVTEEEANGEESLDVRIQ